MWPSIARLFPPPRALAMLPVGLEISDANVRALAFRGTPGDLAVAWWAEEPLPEGAVVGGRVRREEAITEVIKKIRAAHPFSFVALALPEQLSYVFEVSVSADTPAAAREEIGERLEEQVPIRASDAIFDIFPIGEKVYRVAAVSRVAVEAYEQACRAGGVALVACDTEPAAVCRAAVGVGNRHTLLVVNSAEDDVGLYIAAHGSVRYAATVSLPAAQVRAGVSRAATALQGEIARITAFWESRAGEGAVQAAVLCGAGASPEFAAALAGVLALPVEEAAVWQNAFSLHERVPSIPRGDALRFAASIGVALRAYSYV